MSERRDGFHKSNATAGTSTGTHDPSVDEVETTLAIVISSWLGIDAGEIDRTDELLAIGFGSLETVHLIADIEDRYGVLLDFLAILDHGTIATIARAITSALNK